jgi:hypothetical protein
MSWAGSTPLPFGGTTVSRPRAVRRNRATDPRRPEPSVTPASFAERTQTRKKCPRLGAFAAYLLAASATAAGGDA